MNEKIRICFFYDAQFALVFGDEFHTIFKIKLLSSFAIRTCGKWFGFIVVVIYPTIM